MPATPRPSRQTIFRRRRAALVACVVLMLAALVFLVPHLVGSGADSTAEAPDTPTASPTPTSVTAQDVAPTPDAGGGASTATSAAPTAEALQPCIPPEVVLTAKLDAETYSADQQPKLSLVLENTGSKPCTIDVGTAKQVYTITSGADHIWTSTDCQSEARSQPVQLGAGQRLEASPITWVKERSAPSSCSGERPKALPGTYQLTVQMDSLTSEPARFVLQ
ncbi:hypothetical protein JRG19_01010 [Pseudoclavibacter alba]|uniref:hypothetical protein n=1 Tax=Pseudoclavibacter albus TaxID=272241 RepID=UPI0019D278ED|nr:hypothetical protein [Pseudoclavibacter alba]MBN6777129.1 hypothetical protein [Pseudoclavibacter alba]